MTVWPEMKVESPTAEVAKAHGLSSEIPPAVKKRLDEMNTILNLSVANLARELKECQAQMASMKEDITKLVLQETRSQTHAWPVPDLEASWDDSKDVVDTVAIPSATSPPSARRGFLEYDQGIEKLKHNQETQALKAHVKTATRLVSTCCSRINAIEIQIFGQAAPWGPTQKSDDGEEVQDWQSDETATRMPSRLQSAILDLDESKTDNAFVVTRNDLSALPLQQNLLCSPNVNAQEAQAQPLASDAALEVAHKISQHLSVQIRPMPQMPPSTSQGSSLQVQPASQYKNTARQSWAMDSSMPVQRPTNMVQAVQDSGLKAHPGQLAALSNVALTNLAAAVRPKPAGMSSGRLPPGGEQPVRLPLRAGLMASALASTRDT
jgi:hypothetical protein